MSSNYLAETFRSQAEWRDTKAEEYPEDERNAQGAAALRSLADYAESDEREAVSAVQALQPFEHDTGFLMGGEEANRAVSRYGYGYRVTTSSHQEFLVELVALCVQGAYEGVLEGASDDDPSGTLHEFEVEAARDGIHLGGYYFRRRAGSLPHELEAWVEEARADAPQKHAATFLRGDA